MISQQKVILISAVGEKSGILKDDSGKGLLEKSKKW